MTLLKEGQLSLEYPGLARPHNGSLLGGRCEKTGGEATSILFHCPRNASDGVMAIGSGDISRVAMVLRQRCRTTVRFLTDLACQHQVSPFYC